MQMRNKINTNKSMKIGKTITAVLLTTFIFISVFLMQSITITAESCKKVNGVNIVYYWKGDWDNVVPVLNRLKSDGFNYISVCVIWYQQTKTSTEIKPDENMSPTDDEVIYLIREAHKRGMSVMLRPYINIKTGDSWEGEINFGSNVYLWNKWFKNYEKFILHYASIASKENVELFSVGAELEGTVSQIENWEKVINDVRKIYKGKILYGANSGNEKNVKFFDKLDFISLDFYYTLSEKSNPTETDFEETLRKEYVPELRQLYLQYKKPIIISEVGYRSINTAYIDPWNYNKKGIADFKMQAELYEAFLNTVYKENFIKGIFLWYAPPSFDEYNEDFENYYRYDYAFFNKPAEEVIKKFFACSENKDFKNPLIAVNSAAACYSENTTYIKNLASHLDLIVIQTRFLPPDFVSNLAQKTLVAGYVSVLEFDGGKADFEKYKLKDAVIGKNENWNSLIMNINDKNYQKYLLDKIQDVFDSGAQGVFLDTVDNVDIYPELKSGTIDFIKMLHKKYPDKFFIMNRGFSILDDVADGIQGVLFEDFGTYYNFSDKQYEVFDKSDLDWIISVAKKLKSYQDKKEIRVFASGYAPSEFSPLVLFSENLAKEFHFVFYASDIEIEHVFMRFVYPFPKAYHTFAL